MLTEEQKGPWAIDELHECYRLDPVEGRLYHKNRPDKSARWNAKFAGMPAFNTTSAGGYKYGCHRYKSVPAHRVIWAMHYGAWPDGEIDHIDHNRANNKVANLRIVTRSENNRNQPLRRDNRSGRVGVVRAKNGWQAQIGFGGRHHILGKFPTFEEAAAAREAAEIKLGFHSNHGRKELPDAR